MTAFHHLPPEQARIASIILAATEEGMAAWRARESDPVGNAERAAIATQPREATPYTPETPDPYRDGLARGFWTHRRRP